MQGPVRSTGTPDVGDGRKRRVLVLVVVLALRRNHACTRVENVQPTTWDQVCTNLPTC